MIHLSNKPSARQRLAVEVMGLTDLPYEVCKKAVDTVFLSISAALHRKEIVTIHGIGRFLPRKTRGVRFTPSPSLIRDLNSWT